MTKTSLTLILGALAAVALVGTSQAQVEFSDSFESYADQAAFATAWSTANTALALTTTNRSTPSGANSIFQGTAAASSYKAFTNSITSSKLYYRAYFYDAGASRSTCRVEGYTGGTYGTSATQLLAIGRYNSITGSKYYGRQAYGLVGTGEGATAAAANNWFQLGGAANTSGGWHKAEIVGGPDPSGTATIRFRYYIDGVLGGCSYQSSDREFNFAVLGSGSTLTGTGQWFDSVLAEALQMIPEITTQPIAQTVNELQPVTFTVVATNSVATNSYALNTLKYQWQTNQVDIPGATNSSYSIAITHFTDQAFYRCIVTDAYGSQQTASDEVYLTVNAIQAPVIDVALVGTIVNRGSDVTFTVTAHGDAPLHYIWRFNGTDVAYTDTDNTYTLYGVTTNNAGPYTCVVTNDAGAATSAPPAVLSVNMPPVLTSATNQSVAVNTRVSIRMRATDDFSSESIPFQDFETNGNGSYVMFCKPSFSGTTGANIDSSQANFSYVTNGFPAGHGGARALTSRWTWTNTPPGSLRLTTASSGVTLGGSPIISFTNRLRFDICCDRDLQVGLGVRETSPTGAIGTTDPSATTGTTLEWVGVTSSTPSRTAHANTWTTLEFDPLTDPIQAAYGSGNGVLSSTTGKGALEHLYLLPVDNAPNPYVLYLDNFVAVAYHPITFSLESGPSGAAIDEYSGVITWAPTALGDSGFIVIATDYLGLSATNTFTVSVINPAVSVTISNIIGTTLAYGGGSGAKFVLLKSPAANAPLSGWTRVATNTVTPGTFTITTGSAQEFYSIKSE